MNEAGYAQDRGPERGAVDYSRGARDTGSAMNSRLGQAAMQKGQGGGILHDLARTINAESRGMVEIGHKLHEHADLVHGSVNRDGPEYRIPEIEDVAGPALDALSRAIDNMRQANSYAAVAAGRNTTLA